MAKLSKQTTIMLVVFAVLIAVFIGIRLWKARRENFTPFDELAGENLNYTPSDGGIEEGVLPSWNNQKITPTNTPIATPIPLNAPDNYPINPIKNVSMGEMSPHFFQDRRITDTLAIQGFGVPQHYEMRKPVFERPSTMFWANRIVAPECCEWSNLSTSGGCVC